MKPVSLALAILAFCALCPRPGAQTYSGGNGTAANPYLIANLMDLKYLGENRSDWDKHFRQTRGIYLQPGDYQSTGPFYNGGKGFLPIGFSTETQSVPFTGSYDGGGLEIGGLRIKRVSGASRQDTSTGFFGTLGETAVVRKVRLVDLDFYGDRETGGLAGINLGSIDSCSMTGTLKGFGSVGGLVGENDGEITNSKATVILDGSDMTGGLVGWNKSSGSLADDSASATVLDGDRYVGGLVGYNQGDILRCRSGGELEGREVGGLVGHANSFSTLVDSRSSARVSGYIAGGLIGNLASGRAVRCSSTGSVTGYDFLGGLAGILESGSLDSCKATGNVDGDSLVGGLVGQAEYEARMYNSSAEGKVVGRVSTGGLVGENSGEVFNCHATGAVEGGIAVGGLIGLNSGLFIIPDTLVRQASATGNVTGLISVGGLIGRQVDTKAGRLSVSRSFASGSADGHEYTGGLIGYLASGRLADAYAIGGASGVRYTGGLIGYHWSSRVERSYAAGPVRGFAGTGGLAGTGAKDSVAGSFWDSAATGQISSASGSGATSDAMKAQSLYVDAGWDFTRTWTIDAGINQGYPVLRWQARSSLPGVQTLEASGIVNSRFSVTGRITALGQGAVTSHGFVWNTAGTPEVGKDAEKDFGATAGIRAFTHTLTGLLPNTRYHVRAYARNDSGMAYGSELTVLTPLYAGFGTAADPFRIANKADLRFLSEHPKEWVPGRNFVLTADLAFDAADFSAGGAFHNQGEGFLPIGRGSSFPFEGRFDGAGHTLSGLKIQRSNDDEQGLFGNGRNAEILDIGLINVDVSGWWAGGLIGSLSCDRLHPEAGIRRAYVTGRIDGNYAGGLAGVTNGCPVTQSFSLARVTGSDVGGLIGRASRSRISGCFSRGSVDGSHSAGGLVQRLSDSSSVVDCYAAGLVDNSSSNGDFGGLIADTSRSRVINSFWDRHVSLQLFSGGGTGKTTDQMKDPATYTLAGSPGLSAPWDFVGNPNDDTARQDIWSVSPAINDGYPHLPIFNRFPTSLESGPAAATSSAAQVVWAGTGILVRAGQAARLGLTLYGLDGSKVWEQAGLSAPDGTVRFTWPRARSSRLRIAVLRVENLRTGRTERHIRRLAL